MDWGLKRWQPYLESLLIILVVLMPVLKSWELTMPLLLLLWMGSDGTVNLLTGELFGLWAVWILSAALSGSFKAGLPSLISFSGWLGIAYWSGKVVSEKLGRKILLFLGYSSLLWTIIGFWQQISQVPTPAGWLSNAQMNWIKVRSYSVFGNPNIFALYLLGILSIISDLLIESYRYPKTAICFWRKQSSSDFFLYPMKKSRFSGYGRWIYSASLILIFLAVLIALYFTYSRGAWFLGIIFLGLRFGPYFGQRRWMILGITFLFLGTLRGFQIRMGPLLSLTDSSLWYRVRIWQGVFRAIFDHLLWGSGPGSFPWIYPWYQIGTVASLHAHQLYLQIWLENGFFSLIAFFGLFRKMIVSSWPIFGCKGVPAQKGYFATTILQTSISLAAIILLYLGYGLAETWTQNQLIGGYFWFFCGLWISSQGKEIARA